MFLAKIAIMDIFNYTGTIATLGFLLSYLLIAISAPIFLFRCGELKWFHIGLAAVTAGLLCIPLIGSIYPWPAWPMGLLPIIFVIWLAISFVWYRINAQKRKVSDMPDIGVAEQEIL